MYLLKLYSEPDDLFKTIKFVNGVNFIFGKKDNADNPKKSLNGIGKSTLLDLIDFCLLASFQSQHNSRLYLAKHLLKGYKIVLEFQVENEIYCIKRKIDTPNEAEFGVNDNLMVYPIKNLQDKLCDLIFKREDYKGRYSNRWLRRLLPFFLKIQKFKKEKFVDPIVYIKETSVSELNQYHLFLMNINNTFAYKNFNIQTELKHRTPAIREIKKLIEQSYGLKDIPEAKNEINKLNRDIVKLEKAIETFKLADTYKNAEEDANKITGKIKELWYKNFVDRKKVESFKESYKLNININLVKIKTLYKELNELLAQTVKKTLDEAIDFRKKLSKSREDFIFNEIKATEQQVGIREEEIKKLEVKRAELFDFLSTREAIRDLTEAFYSISEKKKQVADIESKIRTYEDLNKERADLKIEESNLEKSILDFISQIKNEVARFSDVFSEIYNSIYPENKDKSIFSISDKLGTDAKMGIEISFPAMHSKGKNQGRTLIYDLAILLHGIENNIKLPIFLIHDGIFDGMDKAHFVALYHFLDKLKKIKKFQYIVTLNEEGTLTANFGDTDRVTPEKIEEESIITLTPSNKLFNMEF